MKHILLGCVSLLNLSLLDRPFKTQFYTLVSLSDITGFLRHFRYFMHSHNVFSKLPLWVSFISFFDILLMLF